MNERVLARTGKQLEKMAPQHMGLGRDEEQSGREGFSGIHQGEGGAGDRGGADRRVKFKDNLNC